MYDLDDYGLPKTRDRATDEEILCNKYAIVAVHLSLAQCAGFAGGWGLVYRGTTCLGRHPSPMGWSA